MRKAVPLVPSRTLLFVVEGEGEAAFCLYLKEFLRGKGFRLVVENAHGGSPDVIVQFAARLPSHQKLVILMDADHRLSKKGQALAKGLKAQVVWASPCLEAEVLRMLGEPVPATTDECARDCARLGLGKSALAERETWRAKFPLETLRAKRGNHPWLDAVLALLDL